MLWQCIRLLLLTTVAVTFAAKTLNLGKKSWEYTVLSINTTSSNKSLAEINLFVTTIGRSQYAASGDLDLKVIVDDKTYGTIAVYRSATGNADYKLTPFGIKKQSLITGMNTVYKPFIMESVKECSNGPQFNGTFEGPLYPKHYVINKCLISIDRLPNYMLPGYYKLLVKLITPDAYEGTITIVVRVENIY